ncbi:MAG TPA: cation transporter [Deltaproteobacteria bacterium]|nr:cation transporter [Deltaproteobacteria bacterium]
MSNQTERSEKLRRGQRIALAATFLLSALAVFKFATGIIFDSKILITDGLHSGVDLIAVLSSWLGLRLAARPKSSRFPYGLYRAETFVTMVIGVFIVWGGAEAFLAGYDRLFGHGFAKPIFPAVPMAVSLLSVFVAFFVARKEKQVGREINSRSLLANASDSFLDIGTSIVVTIGIALNYAQIPYVEGAVIILIAILIVRLGIQNAWRSVLILLDANLDPELQANIGEKVTQIPGVRGVNEIKIRQSGPFKMVECKISANPSIPLYTTHSLADEVESVIQDHEEIESVFVHVEPEGSEIVSMVVPVKEMNGFDSRMHGHFGRAPFFVIIKVTGGQAEIEDFYLNEFLGDKDRIHVGVKVIKAILRHGIDVVVTAQVGEISCHFLRESFVDLFQGEEGLTVSEIIRRYRSGELHAIRPHPIETSIAERSSLHSSGEVT